MPQRRRRAAVSAKLVDGRRRRTPFPSGKDFDPATGKLKDHGLLLLDEAAAAIGRAAATGQIRQSRARRTNPTPRKPYPPFTTSTLQQEANRKLGFTARRTMQVAQSLYENGHITYMRTDSTKLATVAVEAARELVADITAGISARPRRECTRTKVKNAQEAHEAIRPAGHPFDFPETTARRAERRGIQALRLDLEADRRQPDGRRPRTPHYDHSRRRTGAEFRAGGKTIDFPGYLRAYVEGTDDPQAELAENETVLPSVVLGAIAELPSTWCPRAIRRSRPAGSTKPRSRGRWKKWASAGRARTRRSSTRFWPASM